MDTFVTSFEEIGREEGLKEGLKEGRQEGQRELVLHLLERKVGLLPDAVHERVVALEPKALLELSDALLDFTTLSELITWLDQQNSATPPACQPQLGH
jgi:predicted transposase YdaD